MSDTKQVAFSNALWKFYERIGAQGVSLVVSIILARLLSPDDYGAISMVTIFITLADVFVNKGLGSALIQKKTADALDYSSVLLTNLGLSLSLYGLLFLAAPAVAAFFNMEILCAVMRVLGLQTIVAAFSSIMSAHIAKEMLFRKSFFASLIGNVVSAVIGIAMALSGFGVWALVAQQLTNVALNAAVLYGMIGWRYGFFFSFRRVKELLPFGLRIFGAAMVDVGFRQIRQIMIGKKHAAQDLAYFNKGANFPQMIISCVNVAVSSVLYPTLVEMQDDKDRFMAGTRQTLRLTAYLYFPMMAGLAAVAPAFVSVLLTDVWLPCVPYLQVYCFEYATWCIQTTCETAIKSGGHSKLLLYGEIVRKGIVLCILFVSMQYGMVGMACSVVAGAIVNVGVFGILVRKVIGYTFQMQLRDLLPALLLTGVLVLAVLPLSRIDMLPLIKLVLQVSVGIVVYVAASIVTKNNEWLILKKLVFDAVRRKNKP